mmetsp:Transcript_100768/g.289568  ORF Transcript_100768/g.289568 Transcript_100768/m.289568 type:complete len:94 (+) Transcript_100768:3-284(+)
MTETYWQVQPVGWRDRSDTMEQVIEQAVRVAGEAAAKEASEAVEFASPTKPAKTRTTVASRTPDKLPAARKRGALPVAEGSVLKRARPVPVRA